MLVALGSIASQQANAIIKTYDECLWILNYAASNPEATSKYIASDMVPYVHSDASYLSEPKARSRAGGHYFLSDSPVDPTKPPTVRPPLNGPVYSLARILKYVIASAAEAEIGATFVNGQETLPLCVTLEELGHP